MTPQLVRKGIKTSCLLCKVEAWKQVDPQDIGTGRRFVWLPNEKIYTHVCAKCAEQIRRDTAPQTQTPSKPQRTADAERRVHAARTSGGYHRKSPKWFRG